MLVILLVSAGDEANSALEAVLGCQEKKPL